MAKSTLGHAETTPVTQIQESQEPPGFKALFLCWRLKAADYVDPFAARPITPKLGSTSTKDNFAINSILKRRAVSLIPFLVFFLLFFFTFCFIYF